MIIPPTELVLSPETLKTIVRDVIETVSADTAAIWIEHIATGITRISRNRVRLDQQGDTLHLTLDSQFGRRAQVRLEWNQITPEYIRAMVKYAERVAWDQSGDSFPRPITLAPRRIGLNTTMVESTKLAYRDERYAISSKLVQPAIDAKMSAAAFVGILVRSHAYGDSHGRLAAAQETDAEISMTGWTADNASDGWAGQAARDWSKLDPNHVAQQAVRLTSLAVNPAAIEPGRRTAILDRAALAPIVHTMLSDFQADNVGPLVDSVTGHARMDQRVIDERLTIRSDPNDPDGGYFPFDGRGDPLLPMTWIHRGVLKRRYYYPGLAARNGVTPANTAMALRLEGGETSIEEMILNCKEGIYVNRLVDVERVDPLSGVTTGVTSGGCFLIKNGQIVKAVKDLRFLDSPYFFLNRVQAIGVAARAAFGYAPKYGSWPLPPTIVPPIMVNDFNFISLAEAI